MASAIADDTSEKRDLFSLSLNELLSLKIDIASNRPKSLLNQPAAVTVINQEQITQSNARYLMDLLKQVPGFWVGTDTIGTFSASFRGVWGMEAKILLIVDGIEQNELAFGSMVLGNRYPLSTIKQVEIIRGPGAVKYGGQAALAVIRVTTKGDDLDGNIVAVNSDLTESGAYNTTGSWVSGGIVSAEKKLRYAMSASFGNGDYSDKTWTALDGYSFSLENNSNSEPLTFNLSLFSPTYELRFIYDRFRQQDRLLFGDSGLFVSPYQRYTQANQLSFESFNLSFKYQQPISEKMQLETRLVLVDQKPWNSDSQYNQKLRREATRWRGEFLLDYLLSDASNVSLGASYYTENEQVDESHLFDPNTRFDGTNSMSQNDFALYLQYESEMDWANLTVGGRYEDHEFAGNQFVPRIALTRQFEKFHSKFVYNRAFKNLQFDTIASAKNAGTPILQTENTSTFEFEIGYQYSPEILLNSNTYWMKVTDYIAFNPATVSNTTLGDFSSFGEEFMLDWHRDNFNFQSSYSWFQIDQTDISAFTIAADSEAVLGIPNQMLKFSGSYAIDENGSLDFSGSIISARYACVMDVTFVCGEPKKLPAEKQLDLRYRFSGNHYSFFVGVANLLDSEVNLIQPYRGGQSPIPGLGRRLTLGVEYFF